MAPILVTILVIHTFLFSASAAPLPCNLRWKPIDASGAEDWVPVNLLRRPDPIITTEYLVRVKFINSSNPVGRHQIQSMLFNQNTKTFVSTSAKSDERLNDFENNENVFRRYDILTNPHDCKLSWEICQFSGQTFGIQKRAYYVKVTPEEETYVGRKSGESEVTRTHPGGSTVLAYVDNDFGDRTVQCLKSVKGGTVNFTQFVLSENEDNEPSESMLGLDTIDNNSPASVMHRIDHRKKFSETFQFTETYSWEHLSSWSLGIDISASFPIPMPPPIPPITVGFGLSLSWGHMDMKGGETINTTSFKKEREVISSRSIMLGPFSSVQACSISSFQNKLKLNYRAKARHNAPSGTNVEDVKTMLTQVGYTDLKTVGSSIITDMKGDLEGSLAMQTVFMVTELSGGLTCGDLSENFRKRDELRSRIKDGDHNARVELQEVENDISRIKNARGLP